MASKVLLPNFEINTTFLVEGKQICFSLSWQGERKKEKEKSSL
jgi:hypothetical protein